MQRRNRAPDSSLTLATLTASALACAGGCADPSVPITADEVTYWQDARPILERNCVRCHQRDGIGGFDLSSPDTAVALASRIAQVTQSGQMPPYLPGPLGEPLRDDGRLTIEEITMLSDWADQGAQLGDPSQPGEIVPRPSTFTLTDPELTLAIPSEPYYPDDRLDDDYRCFLVPIGVAIQMAALGYRVVPGNRQIVHHLMAFLFSEGVTPLLEARDAESPERQGWPCFSQTAVAPDGTEPAGLLGWWTPGVDGVQFVEGTARSVPPGTVAVVQVHYNTAAWDGVTPDATRMEVFLETPASIPGVQGIAGVGVGIQTLEIPFGEANVVHERTGPVQGWTRNQFSMRYTDGEAWAVGTRAHMHLLATSFRITLNAGSPDERILLDIPRWDFHWQSGWQFVDAFPIRATDTLTVRCTYDNTAENRARVGLDPRDTEPVRWGEGSGDEMCGGGLEIVGSPPTGSSPPAPSCNDIMTGAARPVVVERSLDPLPSGSGGTIRDGLYELSGVTLHQTSGAAGPLDFIERGRADVRSGAWQIAGSETGRPDVRETKTMTTEGVRFLWTMSCPSDATIRGTFDATGDTVTLFYEGRVGGIERRFTRVAD